MASSSKNKKRLVIDDPELVSWFGWAKTSWENKHLPYKMSDSGMLQRLVNMSIDEDQGSRVAVEIKTDMMIKAWQVVRASYGGQLDDSGILAAMIQKRFYELNSLTPEQSALVRIENSIDLVIVMLLNSQADPAADSDSSEE